ncbi:hypothetical protein ACSQ6I_21910 [Anabaena sp. WFMT]
MSIDQAIAPARTCQFADSLSIETRIPLDIHAPHPDFSNKS